MRFDFQSFLAFILSWFTSLGWSMRRVVIVLAFLIIYPLLQLVIWLGFLLDEIFFRQYRQQAVKQPVFIIGMFRSGTTFLHRLLAKDAQFTAMMMWEILFSPSISQRKMVHWLSYLIKKPVEALLSRIEKNWAKRNVMHRVSIRQPEEDDYLLLHRWSTLTAGLSSGLLRLAEPYVRFDQEQTKRKKIMDFYALCVQKHLFARAPSGKHYLAKNPALTPKLQSLQQTFPDAKIIYLVRSPLEVIPSFLSMMDFSWKVVGTTKERKALREFILSMAKHWYRYPLEELAKRDDSTYAVVNYENLVSEPERTVREVYQRLQLPLSEDFANILHQESEGARRYRSQHRYDLASLGLDHAAIVAEFADIFERFGFSTELETERHAHPVLHLN